MMVSSSSSAAGAVEGAVSCARTADAKRTVDAAYSHDCLVMCDAGFIRVVVRVRGENAVNLGARASNEQAMRTASSLKPAGEWVLGA